jgi:hypothetical protein
VQIRNKYQLKFCLRIDRGLMKFRYAIILPVVAIISPPVTSPGGDIATAGVHRTDPDADLGPLFPPAAPDVRMAH